MILEGTGAGTYKGSLSERLVHHLQILWALAKREVQSRFGQNSFGYSWTYIAPLLWIFGTYFFFGFIGRRSPVYTDLITFIISGLVPYLGFRLVINSMGRVIGAVRGVVIYPAVTREHAAIALGLVELVNTFIIFAIVAAVNFVLFNNGELDNPLKFAVGVVLAWGLGAAFGYLLSTLAQIDVTMQHISGPMLRPVIFFSGIFFVANELPEQWLAVFAWNPILHAVEFARDGMLFHYQSRVAEPIYVIQWMAGMMLAAFIVRWLRRS